MKFFLSIFSHHLTSLNNLVTIITRLQVGRSGFDSRQRQGFFLFATASKPALGPAKHPNSWVPRSLSAE